MSSPKITRMFGFLPAAAGLGDCALPVWDGVKTHASTRRHAMRNGFIFMIVRMRLVESRHSRSKKTKWSVYGTLVLQGPNRRSQRIRRFQKYTSPFSLPARRSLGEGVFPPVRISLHAAKTEMVRAGVDFPFAARADDVARTVMIVAKKRPAAMHALFLVRLGGIER